MPRVALFATCLVDAVSPETGVASVRLLEAAGCEVEFPAAQTCCGQPAVNSGEPEAATRLARHFVEVFEPFDAIVAPSGSCAAMVHHWYTRLLDGGWRQRAQAVADKTFELSQYLVDELGRPDLGASLGGTTVTVHDACHGLRNLGLKSSARTLLETAGAEIIEMVEPEMCCGFGGTFAVKYEEISAHLADDKLDHGAQTGARYLTSGDGACLMHLEGRRRRTGTGPECVHFAELLAGGLP
ncbi:MAG: Fe-S oxidoreductase [Actinomycetia bacterium]|nr:Fe-S oxidoreductase [Actinomycetes bacterium]